MANYIFWFLGEILTWVLRTCLAVIAWNSQLADLFHLQRVTIFQGMAIYFLVKSISIIFGESFANINLNNKQQQ